MSFVRIFSFFSILFVLASSAFADPDDSRVKDIYRKLNSMVRPARMRQDYQEISKLGSRLAGSKAEQATFSYFESQLNSIAPHQTRRHPFTVTAPDPESRGTLDVGGHQVSLFPLWPNLVRTSTCDVSGQVVYGGEGTLEALRGLDLQGRIVVLELGVGSTWKNAAKLGAKAVVYLQPSEMPRSNAESKYSGIPVDFPRFYLPIHDAGPVLSAARLGQSGHLQCRQSWRNLPSQIFIAEFPGSDPALAQEPIELIGYADAMSVVPGLAPGAESISGPAILLEAARIYAAFPHRRPLRLVLEGAHGFALQGSREYVETVLQGQEKPAFISLTVDITSGSRSIGDYGRAWFYEFHDEPLDRVRSLSRTFRSHAELLATVENVAPPRLVLIDALNDGDSRTWKNNIPGKFSLDSEPMLGCGFNAITFMTVEDSRDRTDTPFDTLDRVNMANVGRQTQTIVALLHHALDDTADHNSTSDFRLPVNPPSPTYMSLIGGFGKLTGRIVEYDSQKSFVPDTPVPNSIIVDLPKQKTTMGVRNEMMQMVGQDARYRLLGHMPNSGFWVGNGIRSTRLQAYRCDETTGKIDYAASWGVYGDGSYPIEFEMKTAQRDSPVVVFKCEPLSIFDLVDPMSLQALKFIRILDAETDARPVDYGEYDPDFDNRLNPEVEDSQAVFLIKGQRFKLLAGNGPGDAVIIATNSRGADEGGKGYVMPDGGGIFSNLPLTVAKDIASINGARIAKFKKYRIISKGISDLQAEAEKEIALADKATAERDWPNAERHARAAWGYALRAHPVIQGTTNDVVNGVVFYLFLLIPFSYFMERLFFGHQLMTKQLGASISIFIGSFAVLRLIHPAFEIVSNPMMIFIGFVMGTLSLVVVSFILSKFEASLKSIRQAQTGMHEVDIKRSSVAMAAFNLGVSNMRRRKARTILTTLTLVVMTFIVLSFTSIVSELQLNENPSDNTARYSGMLLRNPGLEPLQLATYGLVQNEFSGRGTVVRRAAYYGADIGETGVLTLQRGDKVAEVRCLCGLEPAESKVLRPQEAILPGGRWFKPGETHVMILPTPLAAQLKVDPSEVGKATVTFAGIPYTVIGLVDPGILRSITDLDGDGAMPADFSLSNKAQQESATSTKAFRSYIRLDPATVFIVPTETALNLGSDIRTIAVSFDDPKQTRHSLDDLMPRLRMNLYASVPVAHSPNPGGLEVRQFSVLQGNKGSGVGLILVQLLIASIFVLNTMVASVYERTKEIGIFSSIGLAPNHIAMLFFAESLVYGVLGAVIGYFVAQGLAKVIVAANILQGLTLNFSSTSAVLSAVIVMAVVLLSTIFPARKAAQIAAPARNDDVFQSEPEGDVWVIHLPFSIGDQEAKPLVRFLTEWLKAYEGYTIGEFVTSGTTYEVLPGDKDSYAVETLAWLAPYDLGVSQRLRLVASPAQVFGIYNLDLTLTRQAGDPENWPIVNQRFLGSLRRQFLTWRTLKKDERAKYEVDIPSGPELL